MNLENTIWVITASESGGYFRYPSNKLFKFLPYNKFIVEVNDDKECLECTHFGSYKLEIKSLTLNYDDGDVKLLLISDYGKDHLTGYYYEQKIQFKRR